MGKLKKFIMNKMEKVNVQVSMLTCGLIIFSCLVIYLVTSGVMISMLADAYNELFIRGKGQYGDFRNICCEKR